MASKRLGFLPGWRVFTYVILLFNVAMLIWLIAGASAGHHAGTSDCGSLSAKDCQAAADVGTGIAVVALIAIWALCDVILGVLWLVTRSSKRPCPVCGTGVRRGVFVCSSCGHDFRRLPVPTG